LIPVTAESGEKQVSVVELRNKIKRILGDTSLTRNAKLISRNMKTYGGSSEAARLIEDFVRQI